MLELELSTILLQMANFIILAFVLTRFLFKPLKTTLQKREKEITEQLDKAESLKVEMESLQLDFEEKTSNLEVEISAQKNEARIVIEQTRQQMLQEVQHQIELLSSQADEVLKQKRAEVIQKHRVDIVELTAKLTEKTLADVLNPQIQQAYWDKFLEQIRKIDLATHIGATNQNREIIAEITTSIPLLEDYKTRLTAILNTAASRPIDLVYIVDSTIIAGAVLRLEDIRIDGSLHGQVQQIQKQFLENKNESS